jgi:hypothetical protein
MAVMYVLLELFDEPLVDSAVDLSASLGNMRVPAPKAVLHEDTERFRDTEIRNIYKEVALAAAYRVQNRLDPHPRPR